jgi:hypothetical protein
MKIPDFMERRWGTRENRVMSQKRTFLRQGRMGQWHSSRLKVFQKLFAVGGFPTNGMVTWYPGSSL